MLDDSPRTVLEPVIEDLGRALEAGDIDAAVDLFATDSYWRDLVSMTWNLKTSEGRDGIRATLDSQLAKVKPQNLRLDANEPVSGDASVAEGWIEFETATGRGYGHVRVKDGKIWTLLTTLSELKGFEEPKGTRRPMGAEHGHDRNRLTWKEKREKEAAELGYKEQPYVLIIGGSARGSVSSACRRSSSTSTSARATSGASATNRSACTTRSGTTICPTFPSRRTGRSSRRRTRSATGSRCIRR